MLDTVQKVVAPSGGPRTNPAPIIEMRDLNLWYGEKQALIDVSIDIYDGEILALIGPSGCGKSTFLKCLNRMHDNTRNVRIEGSILMDGHDIFAPDIDPPLHRKRFGWVAQKPNPFVMSIFDNVAYPIRIHGLAASRADLADRVERHLRKAQLWEEVKDSMHRKSGTDLSGGQQQRLCIARALATEPEILLMDEPTGSIDPVATARVEDLMMSLRGDHSVVVVTHSMMEARRIADRVAYFHLGRMLEIGPTDRMFNGATTSKVREFVAGKFG